MNDTPEHDPQRPAGPFEVRQPSEPFIPETREAAPPFPWPPAEDAPIVGALVDTWRSALFRPVSFFRALPQRAPLGSALLYYLVIGILAAAIQLFWDTLLPRSESNALTELLGAVPASPIINFLFSPLLLLLSLFVSAGITHLMVLTLVPGNAGAGATVRVFSFAYSPSLLNAIPYLGPPVAFVWMTILSMIGLREVHHTSTPRAVVAVLVPLVFAGLFIAVSYLLLRSGALLLDP